MTDLTTLANVKLWLGITDGLSDAVLNLLIPSYSEWVRSFTNLDFDVRTYDLWRDGRNGRVLLTPQTPITAIHLLEIDGRAIAAASSFNGPGYRWNEDQVTLSGGLIFCRGSANIHLNYSAGYATIPTDISQAVNELIGLRYSLRDKIGWNSKTLAGEVVSFSQKDMPDSVKTVLNQYANKVPK